MTRRRRVQATVATVSALMLMVCWQAVSNGATDQKVPGVQGKTITIGVAGVMSGPAVAYKQIIDGVLAYFYKMNDQGGVGGYQIKTIVRDSGYTPEGVVRVNKALAQDDVFAVTGVASPAIKTLVPYFRENGTPWFPFTDGGQLLPTAPNIFGTSPDYARMGAFDAQFVSSSGAKKIGMLYEDDAVGQPGLRGADAALKKEGRSLAVSIPFTNTQTDFAPAVATLQSAGADAVIFWGLAPQLVSFLRAVQATDYHPLILGFFGLASQATVRAAGPSAEGLYFSNFELAPDRCSDGYVEAMNKYFPNEISPLSEQGWGMGALIVQGLRGSMQSGPPTRAAFFKALEQVHGTLGCIANVNLSSSNHIATSSASIVRVENGKLVQTKGFTPLPDV